MMSGPAKASGEDYIGRFREIVSDPLNLLIKRCPMAGVVTEGEVMLHNGNLVPADGYFGAFSQILVINRGVHEPLEEYAFQEVLKLMPERPVSLELGAYWSHYSMWLKRVRPNASVWMVEPDPAHLQAGKDNFARNGFTGEFIQARVGPEEFEVDAFMAEHPGLQLDILHSDIDLFEMDMLRGASKLLRDKAAGYIFISTHTQTLHNQVVETLRSAGYRIEISCDFDNETTSFDGFVFASSPRRRRAFRSFRSLGRSEIALSKPAELIRSVRRLL